MSDDLPIREVLPQVLAALREGGVGVLVAPPGAGKTTAVAPALLEEEWCSGQVILTSPRRVAARAAAERMAAMLGEEPGGTIGYATRLESRVSARTRVLVVTEAILVNRLVEDPEMPGVAALLFDEAHERHLDSDLGLALALESRTVLREDLRVLVMSATIEGARFARLLGEGAPVIASQGRSFPLEIKWLGGDASLGIEDRVAGAVMQAWREEAGDVLAFLPGLREIERVRERLEPRLPETPILPLHGAVEPAAQRAAIARDPQGRRRIVLASAIAETSLTLDGVAVVVDSGLARHAKFDPAAGTTHLVTRRASRAAADQRAGRAARQGPGVAYRLWEEGGHFGRPEFAAPEIETADLAPLVLTLARWGMGDPGALPWLDPPPEAAITSARGRLEAMGALDGDGRITPWGEKVAALPMAPDQAAALLLAAEAGCEEDTARLVMLLQERGLGGRGEDLAQRLGGWARERGKRAEAARGTARGWAKRARGLAARGGRALDPFECLALARPDFVARRRDASGENWLAAGGRGFRLDPASPLARAEWIVIGDAQGQAAGARITAGAELLADRVAAIFADRIEEALATDWDGEKKRVRAMRRRRFGAITLASVPEPSPDPQAVVDILVDKALESLGEKEGANSTLLPAGFLARARFAGVDALSLDALRDNAALWLAPLLFGRRDLDIAPGRVAEAALGLVDWDSRQRLDRDAPTHFTSPAGTRHEIDYAGEDAPSVEVRVQALFGLDAHPMIGKTPLLLKLTSPAGRPVQATRDLPGFWRGSWTDVAKDMKGRYPKHRWPERPWEEKPSLKTKNAFNRG
ncbi:ATP-dependent helicase HrpB [Erythrobacter litoralis]|uniref:ATP-dependent helicase n=1 Tax=Erythrobacter litoralis TaxID=39960 RepID=A0A074NLD4_9SPHN|nr:ATP-dependent helicase HrpB [Erythrobacter litoralis]AOL23942.1 ATP-dependent helicase HrpB [Erythrobacter litoralis]KEO98577.1 ATP-dependent helicase [Erythrobacter litoralis]